MNTITLVALQLFGLLGIINGTSIVRPFLNINKGTRVTYTAPMTHGFFPIIHHKDLNLPYGVADIDTIGCEPKGVKFALSSKWRPLHKKMSPFDFVLFLQDILLGMESLYREGYCYTASSWEDFVISDDSSETKYAIGNYSTLTPHIHGQIIPSVMSNIINFSTELSSFKVIPKSCVEISLHESLKFFLDNFETIIESEFNIPITRNILNDLFEYHSSFPSKSFLSFYDYITERVVASIPSDGDFQTSARTLRNNAASIIKSLDNNRLSPPKKSLKSIMDSIYDSIIEISSHSSLSKTVFETRSFLTLGSLLLAPSRKIYLINESHTPTAIASTLHLYHVLTHIHDPNVENTVRLTIIDGLYAIHEILFLYQRILKDMVSYSEDVTVMGKEIGVLSDFFYYMHRYISSRVSDDVSMNELRLIEETSSAILQLVKGVDMDSLANVSSNITLLYLQAVKALTSNSDGVLLSNRPPELNFVDYYDFAQGMTSLYDGTVVDLYKLLLRTIDESINLHESSVFTLYTISETIVRLNFYYKQTLERMLKLRYYLNGPKHVKGIKLAEFFAMKPVVCCTFYQDSKCDICQNWTYHANMEEIQSAKLIDRALSLDPQDEESKDIDSSGFDFAHRKRSSEIQLNSKYNPTDSITFSTKYKDATTTTRFLIKKESKHFIVEESFFPHSNELTNNQPLRQPINKKEATLKIPTIEKKGQKQHHSNFFLPQQGINDSMDALDATEEYNRLTTENALKEWAQRFAKINPIYYKNRLADLQTKVKFLQNTLSGDYRDEKGKKPGKNGFSFLSLFACSSKKKSK